MYRCPASLFSTQPGRFAGYRGVGRHITERKLAEEEHRAHLWFLESMDRINRAIQATNDLERMMSEVLKERSISSRAIAPGSSIRAIPTLCRGMP